jgi:crotonobetainyl-CoA:carnitine CoA-transferase CaiB-like acyl-CoA transferase
MLSHCRALDLTDERGFLCGKILAELGADVIKIEKPGGDPSRKIGPFFGDDNSPEKSLYWAAYNTGKRGITLDIEKPEGRALFGRLAQQADFIIESFDPGYMESLNLGYSSLSRNNRRLIMASITPFGQEGPYSGFKGPDIVVMAMSGILYQTGNSDGPPVHISMPQACLHAGADAAVGIMITYYHREKTGKGQHIDVSMQQSAAWFHGPAMASWQLDGTIAGRTGAFRAGTAKDNIQRQVWPSKDGYVFFNIIGGRTGAKTLSALVQWMDEEKAANDFLLNMDWNNFDMFTVSKEVIESISIPVGEFFKKHTSRELLKGSIPRGISIGPLSSMHDLMNDECLNEREYWKEIEHPEYGIAITYPRRFVISSEKDLSVKFRAPLIGEHNREIFSEAGLSPKDIDSLRKAGVI